MSWFNRHKSLDDITSAFTTVVEDLSAFIVEHTEEVEYLEYKIELERATLNKATLIHNNINKILGVIDD